MRPISWRTVSEVAPGRPSLCLVTFFRLRSVFTTPRFLRMANRVQRHLESGPPGLVGFSLMAKPLSRRFWTLSVWEDEGALMRFVPAEPHRTAMRELAHTMRDFDAVRWTGTGSPPSWEEALGRLEAGR